MTSKLTALDAARERGVGLSLATQRPGNGHCKPASRSNPTCRCSRSWARRPGDHRRRRMRSSRWPPRASRPTAAWPRSWARSGRRLQPVVDRPSATGWPAPAKICRAWSICMPADRKPCRGRTPCAVPCRPAAPGPAGRGGGAEAPGRSAATTAAADWVASAQQRLDAGAAIETLRQHVKTMLVQPGLSARPAKEPTTCCASCSSSSSRALLAWTAVWVVNHPGTVAVQWLDQELVLSVGTVIAVLLAFAAAVDRPVRAAALVAGPAVPLAQLARPAAAGARLRGADAGPDGRRRRRSQRRARPSSPGRALSARQWQPAAAAAQTAQLEGKEEVAHLKFRQMLDRRDAEFVGLRGLLAQAMKTGEYDEALTLARRAYRRSPTTPWVLTTLFELLARAGKWDEALPLIDEMQAQKLLDEAQAKHKRAVLYHMLATRLRQQDRTDDALAQARRAKRRRPTSPRRQCRRPSWPCRPGGAGWRCSCWRTSWRSRAAPRRRAAPMLSSIRTKSPSSVCKRVDTGWRRSNQVRSGDPGPAGRARDAGRQWDTARARLEAPPATVTRVSTGCGPRSSGSRRATRPRRRNGSPGPARPSPTGRGSARIPARCCRAGSPSRPAVASMPSAGHAAAGRHDGGRRGHHLHPAAWHRYRDAGRRRGLRPRGRALTPRRGSASRGALFSAAVAQSVEQLIS